MDTQNPEISGETQMLQKSERETRDKKKNQRIERCYEFHSISSFILISFGAAAVPPNMTFYKE